MDGFFLGTTVDSLKIIGCFHAFVIADVLWKSISKVVSIRLTRQRAFVFGSAGVMMVWYPVKLGCAPVTKVAIHDAV